MEIQCSASNILKLLLARVFIEMASVMLQGQAPLDCCCYFVAYESGYPTLLLVAMAAQGVALHSRCKTKVAEQHLKTFMGVLRSGSTRSLRDKVQRQLGRFSTLDSTGQVCKVDIY